MQHVLPKISTSLVELARVRPTNPAEFLAHYLTEQQNFESNDEDLDDEIVKEFKRLVNASKCD